MTITVKMALVWANKNLGRIDEAMQYVQDLEQYVKQISKSEPWAE